MGNIYGKIESRLGFYCLRCHNRWFLIPADVIPGVCCLSQFRRIEIFMPFIAAILTC